MEVESFDLENVQEWHASLQESFALIGEFLWHFSLLESELDKLLQRMMGLESMSALILTSNIDIAKKINLAICGLEFQGVEHIEAIKDLKALYSINDDRKIVAHCFFGPSKARDGVAFHRTTANSKLKLASLVWTKAEFRSKFTAMDAARDRIGALTAAITPPEEQGTTSLRWLGESLKIGLLGNEG